MNRQRIAIFLWSLLTLFAFGQAAVPTAQTTAVQPQAILKVTFDDLGRMLVPEHAEKMKKYTVALKRRTGYRFHFGSGFLKDGTTMDETAAKLARSLGVGTVPGDHAALMLVLKPRNAELEKTEVRVVLGNGWDGILTDEQCRGMLDNTVMPILKADTVDGDRLSAAVSDAYTRLIAVAWGKAPVLPNVTENTQNGGGTVAGATVPQNTVPVMQNPGAASGDAMQAAAVIASAVKAGNAADTGETGAAGAEMRGVKRLGNYTDPGVPPAYDGLVPPKPAVENYVLDWGELLTPSDRGYVEMLGRKLSGLTTAQLVLVTVPTRGDMPIKEFSIEIANSWGIGHAGKDNGCMLLGIQDRLLNRQSGKIRIEVGRGLEGCLNDAKCGRILDDFALPAFLNDKATASERSAGLVKAYEYLAREIAREYGQDIGIGAQQFYALPEAPQRFTPIVELKGIVNENDRDIITQTGQKLKELTGDELVFVAMEHIIGVSAGTVAEELAGFWHVGDKTNPRGCISVFTFSPGKTKGRLKMRWGDALGPDFQGKFTDGYEAAVNISLVDHANRDDAEEGAYSASIRKAYLCYAQEMMKIRGKDPTELGLPEDTESFEDMTSLDFWTCLVIYVVVGIVLLFTCLPLGVLMFIWPIGVVMLFFPRGRKKLKEIFTATGSSSGRSWGGWSGGRSFGGGWSGGSSGGSSGGWSGGGSFGGGGADR